MTLIKHKTFYNKKENIFIILTIIKHSIEGLFIMNFFINALKILSEVAEECNKEKGSCMNNKCHLFYKNNIIPEQSLRMFKIEIILLGYYL